MRDLIAGAAILPVLIAIIAAHAEAAGCRRLPRMYTGGIHILDRAPRDQGGQPL